MGFRGVRAMVRMSDSQLGRFGENILLPYKGKRQYLQKCQNDNWLLKLLLCQHFVVIASFTLIYDALE